jgi:RNA polymerase sigma-70 factor (ECF subfamily)
MTAVDFSCSFQSYAGNLRAFAYHLTQDKVDAEDLFQDTAYKAFRYRHQYRPQTNLQAWLMTIMRNTFINDWRRRRRIQHFQDAQAQRFVVEKEHTTPNGGEGKVMMEEITQAIDGLEEGLREPFLMAFQGFKYEEIADHMDLPLGTVKSRIHQARKLLKRALRHVYQARQLHDILAD